jgi:hypothetical protein
MVTFLSVVLILVSFGAGAGSKLKMLIPPPTLSVAPGTTLELLENVLCSMTALPKYLTQKASPAPCPPVGTVLLKVLLENVLPVIVNWGVVGSEP